MSVVRINKTNNYTVMSNYHLRDRELSLKAKGLLSVMLSLPDDWDYSIAGLVAICKENETAIKTALRELQQFGYLVVTKLMPDKAKGRAKIEYVYDVFENPKQEGKKQEVENLPLESLHVENQGQLNTNILNTKKLNTNNLSKKENNTENDVEDRNPKKETFNEIIDNYTQNEELRMELKEHLKTRKLKRASLSNRAIQLALKQLDKLSQLDSEKILIVQTAIMHGWTSFYPLRECDRPPEQSKRSYDIEEFEKYSIFDDE